MKIDKKDLPIIIICLKELKKKFIEKLIIAIDNDKEYIPLVESIKIINELVNKYDEKLVIEIIQTSDFIEELAYQIQQMVVLEQFRAIKQLGNDIKIASKLMRKIIAHGKSL